MTVPTVIGIAGGPFCGKKEVSEIIVTRLKESHQSITCHLVTMRDFYREFSMEESMAISQRKIDTDHPNIYDLVKLSRFLSEAKSKVSPSPVLYLIYGVAILHEREIRDLLDMKIFVDVDSDTRLSRRVSQNSLANSLEMDTILNHYLRFAKPTFEDYILPTKRYSDVIIPRGSENKVAIELIVDHLRELMGESNDSCGGGSSYNHKLTLANVSCHSEQTLFQT